MGDWSCPCPASSAMVAWHGGLGQRCGGRHGLAHSVTARSRERRLSVQWNGRLMLSRVTKGLR